MKVNVYTTHRISNPNGPDLAAEHVDCPVPLDDVKAVGRWVHRLFPGAFERFNYGRGYSRFQDGSTLLFPHSGTLHCIKVTPA